MSNRPPFQNSLRGLDAIFGAPPSDSKVRCSDFGVAAFSKDEESRYVLAHCWNYALPIWMWVMLNPSTATHEKPDQTVERCIKFTRRLSEEKAGGLVIVNLFAHRASSPDEITSSSNTHVGADNDEWIQLVLNSGRIVRIVAAWGNDGHFTNRRKEVERMLLDKEKNGGIPVSQINCSTAYGAPRHPSPLARRWTPDDSPLRPYGR